MRPAFVIKTASFLALACALAGVGCSDPAETGGEADGGTSDGGGGGSSTSCALGYLGDPSKDAVLELTARGPDSVSAPLDQGGELAIITPPQGGRVLFVGVRVTNLVPCSVKLAGSVRDKATGQIRIDTRTINLHVEPDGWGTSVDENISTFANIPVCPNQWASTDVFDQPFELTLTLTDKEGKIATKTIDVTPVCNEPGALFDECQCICKQGYVLGEACP